MIWLAATLYTLDLGLTTLFMSTYGLWETNSLVVKLAGLTGSMSVVLVFKICATAPALFTLYRVRATRAGSLGAFVALVIAIWTTACWAAYLSIVTSVDLADMARAGGMDPNYVRLGW